MGRYSFEKKAKFRSEIGTKSKTQIRNVANSPFKGLLEEGKKSDNQNNIKIENCSVQACMTTKQPAQNVQNKEKDNQFPQSNPCLSQALSSDAYPIDYNTNILLGKTLVESVVPSANQTSLNTAAESNEGSPHLMMLGIASPKRSSLTGPVQNISCFNGETSSSATDTSSTTGSSYSPTTVMSEESMDYLSGYGSSNGGIQSVLSVDSKCSEFNSDEGTVPNIVPTIVPTKSEEELLSYEEETRNIAREKFTEMFSKNSSVSGSPPTAQRPYIAPDSPPVDVEFDTDDSASSRPSISNPATPPTPAPVTSHSSYNTSVGKYVQSGPQTPGPMFLRETSSGSVVQREEAIDENEFRRIMKRSTNAPERDRATIDKYVKITTTTNNCHFRSTIFLSPNTIAYELERICEQIDRISLEHHIDHNITYDEINQLCISSYTKYMESKQWTNEFFGNLTPLSHEDHYQLYMSTGIDLDGRYGFLQWIVESYEDELKCYVDFCKRLPEFNKIPINDQIRLVKNAASGFFLILDIWVVDLKNKVVTYPSIMLREARTFHWNDFKTLYSEEYLDVWYDMVQKLSSFNLTENQITVLACLYVHTREFSRTDLGYETASRLQNVLIEALRDSIAKTQKDPTLLPKIMRYLTFDMENFRRIDIQEAYQVFHKFGAITNICLPLTYDIYCPEGEN